METYQAIMEAVMYGIIGTFSALFLFALYWVVEPALTRKERRRNRGG